ncbi:Glycine receptor subunit alpha-2 [Sarcoptes scabiei]|uniref:Glycine receptor subunit alpha-2 n=1 Tax=Sarcoptes scabiei TaxID=52283 RepID=A0A834R6P6_SARSC|nr:Glycine receptor subunit alpha-2 [Sarcoptes scabiei]
MSWISFWIKPEAVPARVTLCVTSLLTLSTQHAQSQKSLPPVSYIKAIDIFMSSCTVFVFASLMEYALVNILMSDELLNGWIGNSPTAYQEARPKIIATNKVDSVSDFNGDYDQQSNPNIFERKSRQESSSSSTTIKPLSRPLATYRIDADNSNETENDCDCSFQPDRSSIRSTHSLTCLDQIGTDLDQRLKFRKVYSKNSQVETCLADGDHSLSSSILINRNNNKNRSLKTTSQVPTTNFDLQNCFTNNLNNDEWSRKYGLNVRTNQKNLESIASTEMISNCIKRKTHTIPSQSVPILNPVHQPPTSGSLLSTRLLYHPNATTNNTINDTDHIHLNANQNSQSKHQYLLHRKHKRAYTIDHISRWIFPLSFIVLNIVYWTYFLDL